MWFLLVPGILLAAAGLVAALADSPAATPEPSGPMRTPVPHLPCAGDFRPPFVVLIGRTGAGKSSIVNRLLKSDVAPVGDVASTTRSLVAYPAQINGHSLTLVDTPGIGEVGTHETYHRGLLAWILERSSSIAAIVLVVAADSRAHAEDLLLVEAATALVHCPLVIALNQCDKMKPVRQSFSSSSWQTEEASGSTKSKNVLEKIGILEEQTQDLDVFKVVVPLAAESEPGFNVEALTSAVERFVALGGLT